MRPRRRSFRHASTAALFSGPVPIAALDLGSNSFHLVVVEARAPTPGAAAPQIRVIERAKEMVRLGEATLVTGVIPTDGFERGLDALARLHAVAARHAPEALLVAATSAIREASNGAEFVAAAEHALGGARIRVLDGAEEARLIYFGARGELDLAGRRVALFDLGGGSLEVIVADAERIAFSASVKIGVLRLKDRFLAGQGDGAVEDDTLESMRTAVRRELEPVVAAARAAGFDFVAFTAGTARALRALGGSLGGGGGIGASSLAATELILRSLPAVERAALPGVDLRRADTLLPGAVVLRAVLELADVREAIYCETALREGMIAAYLAGAW
jgi:exopolyphosphatase/guanosine-5'-triphosphate,3'-diphosphate pyrophosphatase